MTGVLHRQIWIEVQFNLSGYYCVANATLMKLWMCLDIGEVNRYMPYIVHELTVSMVKHYQRQPYARYNTMPHYPGRWQTSLLFNGAHQPKWQGHVYIHGVNAEKVSLVYTFGLCTREAHLEMWMNMSKSAVRCYIVYYIYYINEYKRYLVYGLMAWNKTGLNVFPSKFIQYCMTWRLRKHHQASSRWLWLLDT